MTEQLLCKNLQHVAENNKAFTSYSLKGREQIGRGKFRLHIPYGVVLFLVQFENSISTTLVLTWKRLSWESSCCLSKGSSEKAAISNISKQNNLKQKSKQSHLFWIFFLFHGAAHPRYSCFLIGMLITRVVIKSGWEMMRHHSKDCGGSHNPVSKECSGKISF